MSGRLADVRPVLLSDSCSTPSRVQTCDLRIRSSATPGGGPWNIAQVSEKTALRIGVRRLIVREAARKGNCHGNTLRRLPTDPRGRCPRCPSTRCVTAGGRSKRGHMSPSSNRSLWALARRTVCGHRHQHSHNRSRLRLNMHQDAARIKTVHLRHKLSAVAAGENSRAPVTETVNGLAANRSSGSEHIVNDN